MIFKEHPTQKPPMFSPCLQNLVKTVKHGIRYPSQTHPHLSFQTASCHSTLCFSSTRRTAASTSSSPFVCLILAQASSSTQSALPTSSHLAKPSTPSPGVEKSALGCLLDLFFFFFYPQSDLFCSQMCVHRNCALLHVRTQTFLETFSPFHTWYRSLGVVDTQKHLLLHWL